VTNSSILEKYLVGTVSDDAPLRPAARYSFDSGFYSTLKKRVEEYFNKTQQSPRDVPAMYFKSFLTLSAWFVLYYCTWFAFPDSMLLSAISAFFFGFILACVGMHVMHDGNHGGFSNNPLINKIAGATMDLIGGSSYVWQQIHQVGHHVHTNVDDCDPDIRTHDPHFRRIKESQKWYPHYAYQHIYLLGLYSVLSIEMYFRDVFATIRGSFNGVKFSPIRKDELILFVGAKIGFPILFVVIPLMHYSWQRVAVLAMIYFAMASYTLVTMFQVNHVVEAADFFRPDPVTGKVSTDWAEMQLRGSSNFAAGSWFWNYVSGGLNHQIEHHLFPSVCHVHYPALAPIVRKTAKEFGLPYSNYPSFMSALGGHFGLLRQLGREGKLIKYRPKLE
jgi:fatty acid desaturase